MSLTVGSIAVGLIGRRIFEFYDLPSAPAQPPRLRQQLAANFSRDGSTAHKLTLI
jgi:hypothetical protein